MVLKCCKEGVRKERRKREVTSNMDKPAKLPNKEKQAKHRKMLHVLTHVTLKKKLGLMEEGSYHSPWRLATVGRTGDLEKVGTRTKMSGRRIWSSLV